MELLFESRPYLHSFSGHLNFIQHQPRIHPEPVLRPDTFADGAGVSIYGSVLRDGGRLRMWYLGIPQDWDYQHDMSSVAYAESDDGIQWTKPTLGLLKHGPGPNHLTNLGLHSATVFMDPGSPPSHRYRATGCGYPGLFLCHPEIKEGGYYTAHSADGLDWALDAPTPRWHSADVITTVWHPGRRGALTAMKFTPRAMRLCRRSIHNAEFHDGVYGEPVSALYPDEFDDLCAANRGFHSCDYYGMGMLPAGQGTVGFLWNFWHELPYTGSPTCGVALYGTSDITLVYQPESGGRWFHFPGRPNFVDHTQVPWARNGWINSAASVVEVGDEQRLYFSGTSGSHGFGWTPDWKATPRWVEHTKRHARTGITFASWPKWRLFGFEADAEGSFAIYLGKIEEPSELFLNYEIIKPEGNLTVELRTEAGERINSFEDCVPLTGNSLGERVVWKAGASIPAMPAATVFLRLENARVYAYELRPVKAAEPITVTVAEATAETPCGGGASKARTAVLAGVLAGLGTLSAAAGEPAVGWQDGSAIAAGGLKVTFSQPALVGRSKGYLWFPTIVRLPNGDLVAMMSDYPDTHVAETTSLVAWSSDGGLTWGPLTKALGGDGALTLPNGDELFMPYYLRPAGDGAMIAPYQLCPKGTHELRVVKPGVTVSGWPRADESFSPQLGLSGFVCNGQIVPLKDGGYLGTLYGHFKDCPRYSLVASHSTDGVAWRIRAVIADETCALRGNEGPCESATCRLKDGRLLCVFRMNSGLPFGHSFSADEGRTWSPAAELKTTFSVEPSLAVLPDGVVVLSGGRPGVFLWLNPDGKAEMWQQFDVLANHNARVPVEPIPNSTSAYTEVIALDASHLLLIYDRVPFGWNKIPADSPETNSVWVVRVTVEH